MAAYRVRAHGELSGLLQIARSGEEIDIEENGEVVARLIPNIIQSSDGSNRSIRRRRSGGQNVSGLAGTDLSWLDEPLPVDVQRAFGMID